MSPCLHTQFLGQYLKLQPVGRMIKHVVVRYCNLYSIKPTDQKQSPANSQMLYKPSSESLFYFELNTKH